MDDKFCYIHNEHALFCEQDDSQDLMFYCRFCIQQRIKIQNMENQDNEEKQALKQLELNYDQSIKLLNNFAEVLEQFTQQIQEKLRKFKQLVEQSIQQIIEQKKQFKNISNNFTNLQQNIIQEQQQTINNQLTQIILLLNNQIKELEISSKLDTLYQSIENRCKFQKQEDIKKITMINKKFDYQLIKKSCYKQNEICFAIAFNKDATIMIAGCQHLIKVFEFKNDKLREVQQLSEHSRRVFCLKFMKKSNQFISGSEDMTIMIWKCDLNQLWLCNQVLKEHVSSVCCIAINQNENLLISGSYDQKIIFWKIQNNIWSCDQSFYCKSNVWSISLNDQEDKLIAILQNNQILVIQLQVKEWMIKQNIQVEQYGYRLCFINQNQFVFQPGERQHLLIFDYDAKDQTYKKGQELQYQNNEIEDDGLFPIQYLSNIGLLLVKNSYYVHLIRRNQYGQFKIEQSINFNTYCMDGCISDDGRYIATWDNQSKQIQIRKFEY